MSYASSTRWTVTPVSSSPDAIAHAGQVGVRAAGGAGRSEGCAPMPPRARGAHEGHRQPRGPEPAHRADFRGRGRARARGAPGRAQLGLQQDPVGAEQEAARAAEGPTESVREKDASAMSWPSPARSTAARGRPKKTTRSGAIQDRNRARILPVRARSGRGDRRPRLSPVRLAWAWCDFQARTPRLDGQPAHAPRRLAQLRATRIAARRARPQAAHAGVGAADAVGGQPAPAAPRRGGGAGRAGTRGVRLSPRAEVLPGGSARRGGGGAGRARAAAGAVERRQALARARRGPLARALELARGLRSPLGEPRARRRPSRSRGVRPARHRDRSWPTLSLPTETKLLPDADPESLRGDLSSTPAACGACSPTSANPSRPSTS